MNAQAQTVAYNTSYMSMTKAQNKTLEAIFFPFAFYLIVKISFDYDPVAPIHFKLNIRTERRHVDCVSLCLICL